MTARVVDAVDQLTHVGGEMVLGRHFGRRGNGCLSAKTHENHVSLQRTKNIRHRVIAQRRYIISVGGGTKGHRYSSGDEFEEFFKNAFE